MHVQCGNLPLTDDVTWKCATCYEMIIKMPPRAKHNFRKIQQLKKSSQRNVLAKLLTKSRITISASNSGEQINLSSSSFSASAKACPKFEIPKPVKLGPRDEEVYKDIAIQTIEKIVQEKACLKPILRLPKIELFPNEINEDIKESTAIGSNVEEKEDLESDESKCKQTADNVKKEILERDESESKQTADKAVLTDNLNTLNTQTATLIISPKKKNMGCKRKLQLEVLEDDEREVSAKIICLNDDLEEDEEEKSIKMKQKSILNYFNTRPTNSCA